MYISANTYLRNAIVLMNTRFQRSLCFMLQGVDSTKKTNFLTEEMRIFYYFDMLSISEEEGMVTTE